MLALRSAGRAYDTALARHPIVVKCSSSGAIVSAADATTQLWSTNGKPYDGARTAIIGCYGAFWFAPVMHGVTVRLWGAYAPSTAPLAVAGKTLVDMAVFFPINISAMLGFQSLSRDRSADAAAAVRANLWPSLRAGWCVWPPITFAIYSGAVPLGYRVLAMNVCSFAWNGYMVSRFEEPAGA